MTDAEIFKTNPRELQPIILEMLFDKLTKKFNDEFEICFESSLSTVIEEDKDKILTIEINKFEEYELELLFHPSISVDLRSYPININIIGQRGLGGDYIEKTDIGNLKCYKYSMLWNMIKLAINSATVQHNIEIAFRDKD